MAKPNYQFEKRQKELAKKKKQEEKRLRKVAEKAGTQPEDSPDKPAGEGGAVPSA